MNIGLSINAAAIARRTPQARIGEAVECSAFERCALADIYWEQIWKSVKNSCDLYHPEQTTFHFPVSDCCYVNDTHTRERLADALLRASDLGLRGVVVCSNQVHPLQRWRKSALQDQRLQILDVLGNLQANHLSGRTWLALENMPVICTGGIASLFCYPRDFRNLDAYPLGIAWNFGNFVSTLINTGHQSGNCNGSDLDLRYPNTQRCHFFDFTALRKHIVHWHFSAVGHISDRFSSVEQWTDKVLPEDGILPISIYREALKIIFQMELGGNLILELTEQSHARESLGLRFLDWAMSIREEAGYGFETEPPAIQRSAG